MTIGNFDCDRGRFPRDAYFSVAWRWTDHVRDFLCQKIFRCSLLSPFPIYYRVSPEKPFPEINSTRHHSFPLFKFTKKDLTPKLTTLHLENCTFHQIYTSLNSRQFQPSFSR